MAIVLLRRQQGVPTGCVECQGDYEICDFIFSGVKFLVLISSVNGFSCCDFQGLTCMFRQTIQLDSRFLPPLADAAPLGFVGLRGAMRICILHPYGWENGWVHILNSKNATRQQLWYHLPGFLGCWRVYNCITLPERDVYNKIVKEILIPIFIPLWICRGRTLASVPGTLETLRWNLIIFHFPCHTIDGKSMFLPWRDWPFSQCRHSRWHVSDGQ